MKTTRFLLFIFLSVFIINTLDAQELKENEIIVIKGEKYVLHQVRTGETIYSISRDYKLEKSELEKYNPKIADGLNIGEILKIPYRKGVDISENLENEKGDPTGFKTYRVTSRRETAYFIANKFGITVEDIYRYNKKSKKFRRGTDIKIPVWETKPEVPEEQIVTKEEKEPEKTPDEGKEMKIHKVVSGETLYSISKRYNVSENEILKYNPGAGNLKAGAVLSIPVEAKTVTATADTVQQKITANIKYFEHIIESGETLWGTARKYGVSEKELKEINPALQKGFQAGMVIKIPVKEELETTEAKPVNNEAFIKHQVASGETLYRLAAEYKLTIPQIKKYNPVLNKRNLVAGETILIPQKTETDSLNTDVVVVADSTVKAEEYFKIEIPTVEIPESCRHTGQANVTDTFDIALLLPLYIVANDTLNREIVMPDSLAYLKTGEIVDSVANSDLTEANRDTTIEEITKEEVFKQFYGNSEKYIEFYEGVLIAVDSMQNTGMNIRLTVFDTQRNTDSVRQFINSEKFLATDLIIGPVYPGIQKEIANIALKNKIPIISPLSSRSYNIQNNSEFFQVVPSRKYIAEQTAEMVAEEYFNSNFVVIKMGDYTNTPEGELISMIREKLYNSGFFSSLNGVTFKVYDFKKEGPYGLRRIMSKTKENVVYIASSEEGDVSVAVSNINNIADDYSITLIGSSRYQSFHSINLEQFHNLKLKFIAPSWIDYNSRAAVTFIKKYKNNFGTEPGRYGIQGYDVSLYFLTALKYYGKNFGDCLPYLQIPQVQGNYHFEKVSQFGGYMNRGVSVISYTRNYEVHRTRIKGQPVLIATE